MSYLVGIVIGAVLGLTGAGGSVFAVPLLIALLGLPPQQAIGVSLGAVAASALFGMLAHLKDRNIQWLPALVFATVGGLFAPVGNRLNQQVDSRWLMTGFVVLVLIVAWNLWRQAVRRPDNTLAVRAELDALSDNRQAVCRVNDHKPFKIGLRCVLGIVGGAVLTGLLSGLFGVGGGFLIVPTLIFLTGIAIRQAVATSLVVIAVISMSGFLSFLNDAADMSYALLLQIAVGGIAGMIAGMVAGKYIAGPVLQKIFAVLMLLMAGLTLYGIYR